MPATLEEVFAGFARARDYYLVVPMTPVPKQRARTYQRAVAPGIVLKGAYTPRETVDAEETIRRAWLATNGVTVKSWGPHAGLRLTVVVYLERPPSVSKRRKLPSVKPDWDNLGKGASDALSKGIAYRDDGQITRAEVRKRYCPAPEWMGLGQGPGLYIHLEEDTE